MSRRAALRRTHFARARRFGSKGLCAEKIIHPRTRQRLQLVASSYVIGQALGSISFALHSGQFSRRALPAGSLLGVCFAVGAFLKTL